MNIVNAFVNLLLYIYIQAYLCNCFDTGRFFEFLNRETLEFNQIAAEIAWESSIEPGNPALREKAADYQKNLIDWRENACASLLDLTLSGMLNNTEQRQAHLLCRGPKYSFKETREISDLTEELQSIYSDAKICIPTANTVTKSNLTAIEDAILTHLSTVKSFLNVDRMDPTSDAEKIENNILCLNGEEDVDMMMVFSRNEQVLRWLWLVWRDTVGPPMKEPYKTLVEIENRASRRNGYADIGASWREELEIPKLRELCQDLYSSIKHLYELLHGVTRFFLRRRYGAMVPERGAIPAHLLGNLWSTNWEPLADLIVPKILHLDESIKRLNWTVIHMVKRAEDFYQSLGLPALGDSFWRQSVFFRAEHPNVRCHGTAADMFRDGDYRLLYCSGTGTEDFYVLHHEMGHIYYYISYETQPAIFRQANTALHEAVGDTIMYGVTTPQHLHRLGLVNESVLYNSSTMKLNLTPNDVNIGTGDKILSPSKNKNIAFDETSEIFFDGEELPDLFSSDDILLLKTALYKIPQIPFSLMIDKFRWKYFESNGNEDLNKYFWELALELQGIAPPSMRSDDDFDIGAKFHVADNTPYIRYFLSQFLQLQLFERLCKVAVFGRRDVTDPLPQSIPLMRCDIYGSKAAGKVLKDLMSRGHSQHWREILTATIGESQISSSAMQQYYRPLSVLLERVVKKYRIPIGW